MTQRHLLVFTFLVSFVLNAYSAIELRSTQMRTSDGLPNNSIRYIYQDSKGFLWLATLNGLSRYDGNSFLTFRPEAGDKVSLELEKGKQRTLKKVSQQRIQLKP